MEMEYKNGVEKYLIPKMHMKYLSMMESFDHLHVGKYLAIKLKMQRKLRTLQNLNVNTLALINQFVNYMQ